MTTLGSLLHGFRPTACATACARAGGLLALSLAAHAQTAPEWSVAAPGVTAIGSALDRSNSVLAAGTNATPAMQVTKVGPKGAALWQQAFAGAAKSRAVAMAVDASDNVILAGMLIGADGLTPTGSVLLKYSAAGVLLWQDVVSTTWGMAADVKVDASGNVYLLSRMAQAGTTSTEEDTLVKFSPDGVRQWSRTLSVRLPGLQPMAITPTGQVVVGARNSISGQYGLVAYDAAGNLVWSGAVASSSDVALATGPAGELVVAGRNASGFQLNKYDAQFNALWFQTVPARGGATRVAVDGSGNIVLSGPVDTNTGLLTVVQNDWLTAKLSPQGTLLWSSTWGEAGVNDVPNALALGADGSVNVTGLGSMMVTPATGSAYRAASTVTLKYDSSGKLLWTGNALASSQGVALNLGSDGATYVAAGGQVALGGAPLTVMRYAAPVVANLAPVAMASASTSAGVAPLAVTFSATGSSDPDGQIASYLWNFGDGASSSLASPSHNYVAGSYSATLTVTDNAGASATSGPIAIKVSSPPQAQPAPQLPAQPAALALAASTLVGGATTTGAVALTTAAGTKVRLQSNSSKAVVPASITVLAGATTGSFSITTRRVLVATAVTLSATANGVTVKTKLTLKPRSAAAPA
jgi:PKD repeat protein